MTCNLTTSEQQKLTSWKTQWIYFWTCRVKSSLADQFTGFERQHVSSLLVGVVSCQYGSGFLFQLLLLHPRSLVFLSAPVNRPPARSGPLVPPRWPYPDNKMLSPRFVPPQPSSLWACCVIEQTTGRLYLAAVLSVVASWLWQLIGWEALQGDSNIFLHLLYWEERMNESPRSVQGGDFWLCIEGACPSPFHVWNAPFLLSTAVWLVYFPPLTHDVARVVMRNVTAHVTMPYGWMCCKI